MGTHFNYDDEDESTIIEGILNDDLDGDDLMSGATVLGYSVTEAGLILAKTYKSSSFDVHYGTNLKYQRVDLFNYTDTISSFDSDNFDAEEYLADDSQFNLDLGVQIAWGAQRQWQAGLAAKNLMGFDLDSAPLLDDGGNELPDSSYSFSLDPVVTAGLSYDNGTFRLAAEADLTSHGEFASLDEVQYAKVGLELDAWEWAQLRLGYRTDMKSNATDVATVGLGLSPFDVVALDLAAIAGSDNTYGGVIQLGVKF